jgi:ACR3 family arsenite transporter
LATAIGPLIEVPVLIALVYAALWIHRTFFGRGIPGLSNVVG